MVDFLGMCIIRQCLEGEAKFWKALIKYRQTSNNYILGGKYFYTYLINIANGTTSITRVVIWGVKPIWVRDE